MASALITNRQYTNFYKNTNTSWLIGNVGDVVELTLDIEASISFLSTFQTQVKVSGTSITRAVGSWYDEGFAQGQTVNLAYTITTDGVPVTGTILGRQIVTLTPTLMILDGASIGNYFFPFQQNINDIDLEFSGLTIACVSTDPFAGIEMQYGLTTNSQVGSGDLSSLIDGTILTFKKNNITSLIADPIQDLIPFNFRSGGSILSATIKGKTILPSSVVKLYEIKIKFIITPFYLNADELANIQLPNPFKDTECLTDILKINLLPEINNPNINVAVKGSDVVLKGNTGWFNENYNGGVNNYSINTVTLLNELGVSTSGITTTGKTDFTIIINQSGATALNDYKLGFAWTPVTPTIYSENLYGNHENLLYNGCSDTTSLNSATAGQTFTGYTNGDGARMDIEFVSITLQASTVTIRGKFAPNTEFSTLMDSVNEEDLSYLIWVSVGDDLDVNVSDRVSLIANYSSFVIPPVATEQFNVTNSFLGHCQTSEQVGSNFYEGCTEDEVSARSVILLDTALDETVQEITFTIEGLNFVTNERYVLESTSYDCTGFVKDANNIQQININATRGFLMASGVEKNEVKVFRNPADDSGSLKGYKSVYGFKLRWEDWISRATVPSEFYDNTQLNNNLNNNWANKDDPTNWKLTYCVNLKVLRQGVLINTKNSFDFIVRKYEESIVYDGAITNYNSDKTNSLFIGFDIDGIRNNAILGGEDTWIEADFDLEDLLGDVGNIGDYFGVLRIEEWRNGGIYKIEILSTFLDNTNNILIPLVGETKAKITKVSDTKIRVEGLIDYTKLNQSNSTYKVSARLGCKDINLGKYSGKYSLKYN